jgi:DNA-binding protein YbaB
VHVPQQISGLSSIHSEESCEELYVTVVVNAALDVRSVSVMTHLLDEEP